MELANNSTTFFLKLQYPNFFGSGVVTCYKIQSQRMEHRDKKIPKKFFVFLSSAEAFSTRIQTLRRKSGGVSGLEGSYTVGTICHSSEHSAGGAKSQEVSSSEAVESVISGVRSSYWFCQIGCAFLQQKNFKERTQ